MAVDRAMEVDVDGVAGFLQRVRARRGLTQREWSRRSGVAQSTIAAYEKGRRVPTLEDVATLLEPLGLRPVLETAPLWGEVDRALRERAGESMQQRSDALPWFPLFFFQRLDGLPWCVAGAAAAVLQGVPVPVEWVDLWVPSDDESLDRMAEALEPAVSGWDPLARLADGRWVSPETLRVAGGTHWRGLIGTLRVTVVEPAAMPAPRVLDVEGHRTPVVPLPQVEVADRATARLLARARTVLADRFAVAPEPEPEPEPTTVPQRER